LPTFISISPFTFAQTGAGFLGPQYAPLGVSGVSDDPRARADLTIENLKPTATLDSNSVKARRMLLDEMQRDFNTKYESDSVAAHRANYARALRMVETQGRQAFRLDQEPNALRDAYGRNRFGQGCLLARRLVERGVPFVEVSLSGVGRGAALGWDTHQNNFEAVKQLSQVLDPAFATLLEDLRTRGLLDATLVVWMGEFGRTPKINPNSGRDHFPAAWSTVLAGGGVKTGQAIGDTGKDGVEVTKRPVTVPEYFATILTALGVDYRKENVTPEGRPIPVVDRGGKPVTELVG
jgi:uncharacterized protein (DUF1501 family)